MSEPTTMPVRRDPLGRLTLPRGWLNASLFRRGLEPSDFAVRSGISYNTLVRLNSECPGRVSTLAKVLRTLDAIPVLASAAELIPEHKNVAAEG